jgi:hypothetical protein
MPRPRAKLVPPSSDALVVSDDPELLTQLRDYLIRAGVPARATRRLGDAWLRGSSEALVLLPDDFETGQVTDGLSRLLSLPRCPLVIVITAGPRLYEPLIESCGNPESVVLMPKPVWGWTILDLLRAWKDGVGR